MKILKILGIVVVVLVAIVLIMMMVLPDTAHLERSITINASKKTVYTELISYRNFNKWSPWAQKDPNASVTISGPLFGVGMKYAWSGNQDVGTGSMEIIEASPGKITSVMDFGYNSYPKAAYVLEEVDNGTKVTWTYDEEDVSGMAKLFMLGLESFLGPDYEQGLENLKNRLESAPAFSSDVSLEMIESYYYLGVSTESESEPSMVATKMAQSYGEIVEYMNKNELEATGAPMAEYMSIGDSEMSFICGIPVADRVETDGNIVLKNSYEGEAVKLAYKGDYNGLSTAYDQLELFVDFFDFEKTGNPWEEYITDPTAESDTSEWLTYVYYPVK